MPSQSTVRTLAKMIGLSRAAIGVATLASPAALRPWAGDVVDEPGGALAARVFGARDAALGLGVYLSARRGAPLKTWLRLSGACDVADLAATGAAGTDGLGPMAAPTMGLAAAGAIGSFTLAAWSDA